VENLKIQILNLIQDKNSNPELDSGQKFKNSIINQKLIIRVN